MDDRQILEAAKNVLKIEQEALAKISDNLSDSFPEIVRLISASRKIIVSGVGKSGLIGRKIAATFLSIGKPASFLHSADAMHGDLGMVEEGDICLLLSKSGSTEEIVRMLPFLKSRGAILIAISSNPNSYLAKNADYWLNSHVDKEGCPIETAPMASALVSLAIGDALAACVMKLKGITASDFSLQHPLGQIGRNLTLKVKDVMHHGQDIPTIHEHASFKDAVIEISRKSLGCVCIINSENKLLGIITDGDVRRVLSNRDDISSVMAKSVMTENPITVNSLKLLGEALSLMENRKSQINVLPVVNSNHELEGVIRIHDIIKSGL